MANTHAPSVPAGARRTAAPGGGANYTTRNGASYRTNASGHVTRYQDQNHTARFDSAGHAQYVESRHAGVTTTVMRGRTGRTIDTRYANGTRVVNYGHGRGFVERPIAGRAGYVQRTYAYGGVNHVYVYHTYSYYGHPYYVYTPAFYYHPIFYGWVNAPWRAPVVYSWGVYPWGPMYGAYFVPYPNYDSPDLWLADYVMFTALQNAYAAQQAASASAAANGGDDQGGYDNAPPPDQSGDQPASVTNGQGQLDPAVKALIAQQVKADVSDMQAAAGNPNAPPPSDQSTPAVLQPDHTAFQVSTDTQLHYGDDQTCTVSAGDVLFRKADSMADPQGDVNVTVVGSKPGGCPVNTQAKVEVATLQEMDNQFEQQLQGGMQVLATKSGGSGPFPAAPNAAQVQVASGQAPADLNVQAVLNQNQQAGDQAEADVQTAVANPGS
jgi:hypothetical protein